MRHLSFFAILIALLLPSNAALAGIIGKVVAVAGAPTSSGPEGSRALKAGGDVFEKDKITVGSGNAQIMLSDGTKLVVGPGSSLVLEKYLMRGTNSAQKISVKALRGTFRFITGRSAKGAYNIRTANATIGIRGTGFDFSVAKNTLVAVYQGRVKLCGKGPCLDLKAGCEMGETAPPKAQKLVGRDKASRIKERLPFVAYQSNLNSAFRLNTGSCRSTLNLYENEGNGNSAVPPVPDRVCTTTPNGTICR